MVSLVVNYCTGESLDTLRDALTPLSEPPGGDLPAGTSASGRAPIGSSVTGNIESATDRDWFRVRFDGRIGERVYWLELKGADTGDGTLPDPLIVGIYDRQGNYIPYSHVAGQFKTYDNDSGYGRNAITDFTERCAGDYFVAVAGYEGSTGSYTLSVTDITDTSTSIPADDYEGFGFANWTGFYGAFDGTSQGDELVGNLAPGMPATAPVYETDYELFRLGVLPGRNYRVEVRLPATTGGELADVDVRLLLGVHPYSDLGGQIRPTPFSDTSQTSRISLAIPAWSSQGREPGISAGPMAGVSYRPDGSFLWISWEKILNRATPTPLC